MFEGVRVIVSVGGRVGGVEIIAGEGVWVG